MLQLQASVTHALVVHIIVHTYVEFILCYQVYYTQYILKDACPPRTYVEFILCYQEYSQRCRRTYMSNSYRRTYCNILSTIF